jgi:hypothetical protein
MDDCGRESLFQAQIRRIEEFIVESRQHKHTYQHKNNQQTPDNTPTTTTNTTTPTTPTTTNTPTTPTTPTTPPPFSLLVVDEILNSTNPIEAMLLSYQYAKTIGSELFGSTRMVMTTHYPVLTTLAETQHAFVNWAMLPDFKICTNRRCKASSAIGTVKQMTHVLTPADHASLEKAYKRMYKKLAKMRFRELDGVDAVGDDSKADVVVKNNNNNERLTDGVNDKGNHPEDADTDSPSKPLPPSPQEAVESTKSSTPNSAIIQDSA